ncbi:MAG: CsbD family protein [Gammaproteobacteria bacterium]|nr:CsbD family protein [Pseudomonadales bacterium]MCP5347980.1 CsbD family protein [Pseudomonadales bacterium]
MLNSDILGGKWKQLKGEAKQQWGKLTDDDLDRIDGSSEKLTGLVQERYGLTREKAEKEVEAWANRH